MEIDKLNIEIDKLVSRIDDSINDFKLNVSIALFYESYKILNGHLNAKIDNQSLVNNVTKIMKLMIPFVPHLANECLEMHKCDTRDTWPLIKKNVSTDINFAVQINGKTRDIIKMNKNLSEVEVKVIAEGSLKVKKHIENKKISKIIFVKNRIINYII